VVATEAGSLRGQLQSSTRSLQAESSSGIVFPEFRFVPFCSLDEETQLQAEAMEWTPESWDVPGTAQVERKSFSDILKESEKKNDSVAETMIAMGWTEDSYDCYMNHYENYDWKELEKETDTIVYWTALGWNESRWEGDMEYPNTDEKDWSELTGDEQKAAAALCYFEELWNNMNIQEWNDFSEGVACNSTAQMGLVATSVPSMGASESTTMETSQVSDLTGEEDEAVYVANPNNRFLLWSWLFEISQAAATTLGYTEETWNQITTNPVEALKFDDLSVDQVEAAYVLGLAPANIWDCYINHYTGWTWNGFAGRGIRKHYITLGWNASSWDGTIDPPATANTPYEMLTVEQQKAAEQLCYRKETWDKTNLNEWAM